MKKYLSFLFIIVVLLLCSCEKSIAPNDPKTDAKNMYQKVFKAIEKEDFSEANDVMGIYYEAYAERDLADRILFFRKFYQHLETNDNEGVFFNSTNKLKDEPNYIRLILLMRKTLKECKKLGIDNLWKLWE